ncbi:MAG: hypothetical protein ACOH2V_01220 [Candidatus Saccharimonadaceae bacterium]
MGTNAQQKLSATAALNGTSDPLQFIMGMLEAGTDISTTSDISTIANPKTGRSGDSGSEGKIAPTPVELFHGDRLYKPGTTYQINNPTAGIQLDMAATGIAPLYSISAHGETVGPSPVSQIMIKDNLQTLINPKQAYIGDTPVDMYSFGELAYSGDDVAKVYIPVKSDGSPDLASMEKFKGVYDTFQANKNKWSIAESEKFFRTNNFPGVTIRQIVGSDGVASQEVIENNMVKPFLALPVLTNSASELSDLP